MQLTDFFLIIGTIIMIGFAGRLIRQRTSVPESLFLIIFGLVLGPVTGFVSGDALQEFVPIVSVAAMVAILIESGVEFDISKMRTTVGTAALFTIFIALLTTTLIAILLVSAFNWEPSYAALLGLICSGTTTITAMSLLKGIDVSNRIRRLILLETIINDFTLIVGTVLIVQFIKFATFRLEEAGFAMMTELIGGVLLGTISGFVWRYVLEEVNLRRELNYASTIGFCFVLYYLASLLGGNPIIAIFAFSLVLGNYYRIQDFVRPEEGAAEGDFNLVLRSLRYVQKDFTFFAASFFFVLLGITFDISALSQISVLLIGSIVLLILLARFTASSLLSRLDKEFSGYQAIITVMIPRGYVAAVLAFVPAQEGVDIPLLKDTVLILIMVTTMIAIFGTMFYARRSGKKKRR